MSASSETQGQLVGAGKSLSGRGKKSGEEKSRTKYRAPGILLLTDQFRNHIPGALYFVLDFSSPDFFPRPFRLFHAPTNCPGSPRMVDDLIARAVPPF